MGSITEKIEYLQETKEAIKYALIGQGQSVSSADTFRSYADKVASIEGGAATLITKTITENGVYDAEDDDADGYDEVIVNVESSSEDTNTPILLGGISGTVNAGSVTSIISYAAVSNSGITEIKGSLVEYVGSGAFLLCQNLQSVSFPEALSFFGSTTGDGGTFGSCTKLTDVYAPKLKYLSVVTFNSCTSLQQVSFPSVVSIGSWAFRGCTNLESADFPLVTTVGSRAFGLCSNISTANFPVLTVVPSNAFDHCSKLTSVSMPMVLSIVGADIGAFGYCTSLSEVSFPQCQLIGTSAFASCTNLKSISFPNCTSIGSTAFYNCPSLSEASFPNCVTIGYAAFTGCHNLQSVDFPVATVLGTAAFQNCIKLSDVSLPRIVSVYSSAFRFGANSASASTYGNSVLSELYLPNCSIIWTDAIIRAIGLRKVSLPMISSINNYFCYQCSSLESVYLFGESVATLGSSAFLLTPLLDSTILGYFGSIYVRASLLTSWKTATRWSAFSDRFVGLTDEEIEALE